METDEEWQRILDAADVDLRDRPPAPGQEGPIWELVRALAPLARELRRTSAMTEARAARAADPAAAGAVPAERAFLVVARLRAAVASFLLAPASVAPEHVRGGWSRLLALLRELHGALALPETALLLENLPGLVVPRLDVAVPRDREGAFRAMDAAVRCVRHMAGAETVHALEEAGLRTSAALGPGATQSRVEDWVRRWLSVAQGLHAADPRGSAEFLDAPPLRESAPPALGQPGAGLTAAQYDVIFGAPFVQRGLRHLARVGNRVSVVAAHLRRVGDASLTPLTRALFTLALVDEHLLGPDGRGEIPPRVVERFRRDVAQVDPSIMIPPLEAVGMARSRGEVRVSSALSARTPGAASAAPGTLMTRVRTDADVLGGRPQHVSASALAVFQPAISALLQLGEASAAPEVRRRLLDLLHDTWALLQNTASPDAALAALVDAGFTPANCAAYLAALEGFLASGHMPPAGPGADPRELGEIQQLFGCISLLGRWVFALAREYGRHAEYVRTFRRLQAACEQQHARLSHAAGLSRGVLSQALARIMGPVTPTGHLAALRRALVEEFEAAERRFHDGRPSLLREPALAWVDIYGQTTWDVVPHTPHAGTAAATLLPAGPVEHGPEAHVAAAAAIRFPALEFSAPEILADPGFAPYVMALAVGDALEVAAQTAYLPRPLAFAARVLAWARDFGLGYLPSVGGHRTKLGALITLLEPGLRADAPPPAMQTVESVEQLLRELHQIVQTGVEQVAPHVRLRRVAEPGVGDSLLLMSMYALAARGALHELAADADPLVRRLEDAAAALRAHMRALAAFFECRFEGDGARVFALPHAAACGSATGPKLGPWSPDAVADAVSRYCAGYHDAKLSYTAALAGLRSLASETGALQGACEALAAQVALENNVLAHALREINSFALLLSSLHARASRLLTGGRVPAFAPVARFLARWRRLSSAHAAARAAEGPEPVADFVRELRDTWAELRAEGPQATEGAPGSSPEQRALAVREVLASAPRGDEVADGGAAGRGPVTLTSRHNLGAWGDYSLGPLGRPTEYPSSIAMTPQSITAAMGSDWIMTGHLLQVMDGVFRASTVPPGPRQDPPPADGQGSRPRRDSTLETDGAAGDDAMVF
ncbi:tegument protein UL37 [Ateline alphaherpesvirus 1]|uniref:Tegument protein UL37 n=1 Tax=Herpesvirus ateles type 1 (strain Lennette) TaxID=35243 RepID=A0A1S6JLL9_HSVA1|nr:tegument protein UL37 [Ateline alphaherpesvirus 1]AQS79178.1 tegument protein UL37 [Ateline alphaherpesvirus 1]